MAEITPSSFSLPTKKNEIDTSKFALNNQIVLIYGAEKIGKTSLLAGLPGEFSGLADTIWLRTEEGHNFVNLEYDILISSWQQFKQVGSLLKSNNNLPYKNIAIDTIGNLYEMCQHYITQKFKVEHISEIGYGKGTGIAQDEFKRVIKGFSLMPYGLFMIGHAEQEEVDLPSGKVKKYVPRLHKKGREIITEIVDLLLYIDKEKDGTRIINTRSTLFFDAGSRLRFLPPKIECNFEVFLAEYGKAVQKEVGLTTKK